MIFDLGDCELDVGRYELRRGDRVEHVEPQVFDLLVQLVENRERIVTKDEIFATIWKDRIVSDATLSTRINAARRALGDDGRAQRLIKTIPRRGFRYIGEAVVAASAPESELRSGRSPVVRSEQPDPPSVATPHQEIHFHTTADGTALAYSMMGDGLPIVKAANWMNHLEYEINHPPWQVWWSMLAEQHRLIRYDQRGNGLSAAGLDQATFETLVGDLESLVDGIGLQRFALLGISQGCAISTAYVVRHPERVSHMILYGGYVQGWRYRGEAESRRGEAFSTLIEQGWGQDDPAYRQLFASMFMPEARPAEMTAFNEMQRIAVSARNAVSLHELFGAIDVSALLPRVTTPTLVMHCENDARAPFNQGRVFAAGIPNSRFLPLPGRNHILQPGEPAWDRFFPELFAFLAEQD